MAEFNPPLPDNALGGAPPFGDAMGPAIPPDMAMQPGGDIAGGGDPEIPSIEELTAYFQQLPIKALEQYQGMPMEEMVEAFYNIAVENGFIPQDEGTILFAETIAELVQERLDDEEVAAPPEGAMPGGPPPLEGGGAVPGFAPPGNAGGNLPPGLGGF
jgi:hypothetical protein